MGYGSHVLWRRCFQPRHRVMECVGGDEYDIHVSWRLCFQPRHRVMECVEGDEYGIHVLWRRCFQPRRRVMEHVSRRPQVLITRPCTAPKKIREDFKLTVRSSKEKYTISYLPFITI